MKLFSPKQVNEVQKKTEADLVARKIRVEKLLKKEEAQLSETIEKKKPQIAKLQKDFDAYLLEIRTHKGELLRDVEALESRRDKALEPLDKYSLELDQRDEVLNTQEALIKNRLLKIEKDREELIKRVEFCSDKELELGQREEAVHKLEAAVKAEEEQSRNSLFELNKKWEEYHVTVGDKEQELLNHEKRNFEQESALDAVKEALDEKESNLNILKIQLDDRQATLTRAFEELRNKQNG